MSDILWSTREPGEIITVVDDEPETLIFGSPDRLRLPDEPDVLGEDAGREFAIIDQGSASCVCGTQHTTTRHVLEGGVYVVYECVLKGWLTCRLTELPK